MRSAISHAWLFNRCLCMTLLTDSLLVLVAHQSLPGGTDGFSSWCCWCLLGVAIRCGSLRSWSSVLRPLSWRRRPIWFQVCRGVSVPGGGNHIVDRYAHLVFCSLATWPPNFHFSLQARCATSSTLVISRILVLGTLSLRESPTEYTFIKILVESNVLIKRLKTRFISKIVLKCQLKFAS